MQVGKKIFHALHVPFKRNSLACMMVKHQITVRIALAAIKREDQDRAFQVRCWRTNYLRLCIETLRTAKIHNKRAQLLFRWQEEFGYIIKNTEKLKI